MKTARDYFDMALEVDRLANFLAQQSQAATAPLLRYKFHNAGIHLIDYALALNAAGQTINDIARVGRTSRDD